MSIYTHEQLYRTPAVMQRLAEVKLTVCGAGALGANICESLARSGCRQLRVIDNDRIEERNLSTQPYQRADVGAPKGRVLANMLYRAVGVKLTAELKRLAAGNVARLLRDTDLVVDTFDNSRSRQLVQDHCRQAGLPCLHAGLAADYGEVIWDEEYQVPSAAQDDICDYPLARNLVTLTAAVASEVIIEQLAGGCRRSFTITLKDLTISRLV
jgi:molybdopterin/thiamine biosynthesis adenylyltransferase